MVPQQVASLTDGTGNFGTPAHEAANQEKGRTHLMAGQQFKQLLGIGIIGAIIEGESDFLDLGAGEDCAAEDLRRGPVRGIGIPR